jgi:hypothetical protein
MRFALATATFLLLAPPAVADDSSVAAPPPIRPQTQNGVEFVTGGVGDREQAQIRELGNEYNLHLVLTNAEGAYLSDVDVVIEKASGKPLVETRARGPMLLARLTPGRYRIRTEAEGRTDERRVVDITAHRDATRLYVAMLETQTP